MSYQSEAELEKRLLNDLVVHNRYERVTIRNEVDLEDNFRQQFNLFNQEKLNGVPLSDKEYERIMIYLKGKSVYQSAKMLRDKYVLQRDDGSEVYVEFFDSADLGKNIFQVSSQVTVIGKYTNRYDVTILINGLPLVQIELKRRGLDIKEAFNQIERYRKHSYQNLYRFIQIFIISNGVDTKYFANSDGPILYSYVFFWSNDRNDRITNLNDFGETFLDRIHLADVIARFMIVNDTDKLLMVMRPYQIYAVKALVRRAMETKNNGYIWHATGSGKTLTSFKASQIIAQLHDIRKVFFLVDRKDLDTQTMEEFNKFESDSVDKTDRTSVLVKQIKDVNRKLILTTIQKMHRAVLQDYYASTMDQYRDQRVVFIIDECHRSQFGDMYRDISKHFRNAQYFGFTGTPLFEVNKSADGRTTADIFEKCLHTYLLKDAIKDNNVLGFSVEYIKTFHGEYDENDPTKVYDIDTSEVFEDEQRINLIADHIVRHHYNKTRNGEYCAIFATPRIPTLVKYYDAFKKLDHNLKIAAIYTYGANEESEGRDEHSRDSLERIITDYNQMFGTSYSTDTYGSYFRDISKKVKTAQIDILLVVNMFLTGFDSRPLNTLYVDKNLEYHSLLQAFSRTNRVEKKTKPYGNIVCYRNLKRKTDEAICIYSQTASVDDVLMQDYDYYLNEFKKILSEFYRLVLTPNDVDKLETEDEKRKFITLFKELSRLLLILHTFVDFEFEEDVLGISEQQYQDFKSKYLSLYDYIKRQDKEKVSILSDIDFSIEIMQTDRINVAYIMNLIKNIDLSTQNTRKKDAEHIISEMHRSDNPELRRKVELIKSFLERVLPTLSPDSSIMSAYSDYENKVRSEEIEYFANEHELDKGFVLREVSEYEYSGIIRNDEILDELKDKTFLAKRKLKQKIIDFIKSHVEKYE